MPTADRERHTHEKLHAATEATRRGEDREGCRRSIHPCLHPSTRNVLVILCALTQRPSTGTKDYFCGGRNKTPQRSFSNIPYLFYLCLIYFRDILLSPLALFLFFVLFFIFVHFLGGRGGGVIFPFFVFVLFFDISSTTPPPRFSGLPPACSANATRHPPEGAVRCWSCISFHWAGRGQTRAHAQAENLTKNWKFSTTQLSHRICFFSARFLKTIFPPSAALLGVFTEPSARWPGRRRSKCVCRHDCESVCSCVWVCVRPTSCQGLSWWKRWNWMISPTGRTWRTPTGTGRTSACGSTTKVGQTAHTARTNRCLGNESIPERRRRRGEERRGGGVLGK